MNVFHHHDGVVDQDADREDQREQRHAIEREAPGPGGKERRRQRQHDGDADDQRLAPAEGGPHQRDDRERGEDQLLDQLVGLVARGVAVVARLDDLDVGGNQLAFQLRDTLDDRVGDRRGVFAGLLRHRDGHRREFGTGLVALARAVPDVLRRQVGAVGDPGDVGQDHRPAAAAPVGAHADDQLGHVAGVREELPGAHVDVDVAGSEAARRHRYVGGGQRPLDVGHDDAVRVHPLRLDGDAHDVVGPAERGHLARAGHALDLRLDRVRDPGQLQAAGVGPFAEQGEGDDRHIVDAFRLDDRIEHAHVRPDPVAVGHQRVVQPHQRGDAVLADLELHRQDRQPRPGDREHVLDAGDLRDDLLGRHGDDVVHVLRSRARERDQHVGHRHVDLRFLLLRRHEHREDAQQQADQRQQRRDLRRQEGARDAARDAERARAPAVGLCAHFSARPSAWRCRARSSRSARRPAPRCPSSACR